MSRKVVLSKSASKNLDILLEYLELEWSKKVKDTFIKKLDKAVNVLKVNPESSPKSEIIKDLYKCVVTKQTTMFYKFDSKRLYIAKIFDTRQSPEKLKN